MLKHSIIFQSICKISLWTRPTQHHLKTSSVYGKTTFHSMSFQGLSVATDHSIQDHFKLCLWTHITSFNFISRSVCGHTSLHSPSYQALWTHISPFNVTDASTGCSGSGGGRVGVGVGRGGWGVVPGNSIKRSVAC